VQGGQGRLVTRSTASAKKAGSAFESLVASYLAEHIDDRVERRTRNGARDRGDVSGLRQMGERVVFGVKNYGGRIEVGPWLTEAEIERRHDDATSAMVIAKRRGTTNPADQIVLMTLADLVSLLRGERPEAGRDG
jgi:hypothetical protein